MDRRLQEHQQDTQKTTQAQQNVEQTCQLHASSLKLLAGQLLGQCRLQATHSQIGQAQQTIGMYKEHQASKRGYSQPQQQAKQLHVYRQVDRLSSQLATQDLTTYILAQQTRQTHRRQVGIRHACSKRLTHYIGSHNNKQVSQTRQAKEDIGS